MEVGDKVWFFVGKTLLKSRIRGIGEGFTSFMYIFWIDDDTKVEKRSYLVYKNKKSALKNLK